MDITREMIEQRIQDLREARRQQEAQLHGFDGAIQDCIWILQQMDAPEVLKTRPQLVKQEAKADG